MASRTMSISSGIIAAVTLALSGAAWAAEPAPASPAQPAERPAAQNAANDASATPAQQAAAARPQPAPARASSDRLDLDTTVVTGNRELPKVLYIVPWKKADLGDLPAQPFNTLLDEVLTPVDRDVFRREVTYYDALSSGGDAAAAPASAAQPSEPAK